MKFNIRNKQRTRTSNQFYIENFDLKISFKLSLSLGFANLDNQTNKILYVLTLHCKVYTLHYIPYTKELSSPETSQGQGLPTSIRGYILKTFSSIIISKQTNYIIYRHNRFSCRYLHLVESKHLEDGKKCLNKN